MGMRPMKFGMGQAVRRKEDQRFITGTGHYATDYRPEGALTAVLVFLVLVLSCL